MTDETILNLSIFASDQQEFDSKVRKYRDLIEQIVNNKGVVNYNYIVDQVFLPSNLEDSSNRTLKFIEIFLPKIVNNLRIEGKISMVNIIVGTQILTYYCRPDSMVSVSTFKSLSVNNDKSVNIKI